MNYDEDKVDEVTLALLYLVAHERAEGLGARAWKGFDWETLNRIHDKGYISNPLSKAKSIVMTEEGFLKSKELFERYFTKEIKTIPLPKFTGAAKKRWNEVPERVIKDIRDAIWCTRCRTGTPMQLLEGTMSGRSLVLRGTCKKCGGEVARVIEPAEE